MANSLTRWLWTAGAAIAVSGASPLAAQTATAPPPPTTNSATPPAGNDVVGPAQLRDFRLNGTVTQRAEPPPAAATPTPAPAPRPTTTAPRETPAPARTRANESPSAASPPPRDDSAETETARVVAVPEVSSPAATDQIIAPAPGLEPVASVGEPTVEAAVPARDEGSSWPWLLAALAAALGAAYFLWQRRARDEGALSLAAAPGVAAAPSPVPPMARSPGPAQRAPAPTPRSAPASKRPVPPPAAPPPPPPVPGGIVARGLKPSLSFELQPLRAETDGAGAAALLFDVIVRNDGSAPARDVLVQSRLLNAGPRQDEEIGRFFGEPSADGHRLPVIQPMDKVSLKSRLVIPAADLVPVEIEGRKLFVPLVAFNALYRWSGGAEQDSASFLVGRGGAEDGRMAPFRLDRGPKSYVGLGARPHSLGLERG